MLVRKTPQRTHLSGSREILIPIHHVGDENAPEVREPILDLKGEQWFGPVLPPPDETLLVRTAEAAQQEYGNVWGNTKAYTIVFSKSAGRSRQCNLFQWGISL